MFRSQRRRTANHRDEKEIKQRNQAPRMSKNHRYIAYYIVQQSYTHFQKALIDAEAEKAQNKDNL
jgi:hypothetical protein